MAKKNKSFIDVDFTFVDFFALGIAATCLYLVAKGVDRTVSFILVSVISYYFGRKHQG